MVKPILNGGALIPYGPALPAAADTFDGSLFLKTDDTGGAAGLYLFGFVKDNDLGTLGFQVNQAWQNVVTPGSFVLRAGDVMTGNLGIGATPTAKLHISANTSITTPFKITGTQGSSRTWGIEVNGSNAELFKLYDYTASASRLTIDSTGKVGIGNTPTYLLDVGSTTTGTNTLRVTNPNTSATGIASYIQAESSAGSVGLIAYGSGAGASGLQQPSYARINASSGISALVIDAAGSSAPLILGTQSVERMRIDSSGNVGIGTTSPSYRLQLGDGTVSSANRLLFGKAQAASESNLPVIGQQSAGVGNDLALASTSSSGTIRFFTGASTNSGEFGTGSNAERMQLDASGNLLLGTTTNSGKLSVSGTSGSTIGNFGIAADGGRGISIIATGAGAVGTGMLTSNGGSYQLLFGINGVEAARFNLSGNLGIGNTNPAFPLDVAQNGASAIVLSLRGRPSDNNSVLGFYNNTGATQYGAILVAPTSVTLSTRQAASPLIIEINSVEKMRVDGSGNVLIGTTSSDGVNKLQVNGGITGTGIQLSGLTQNSFIYSGTSGAITSTAAPTNGQLLIGSTGAAPVAAALSGTSNRLTVTNGAGSITLDISASYVGQTSITTLGTVATGVWNGTNIDLVHGGTGASLTASNGGIFYSTGSSGAILAGTTSAGQILRSGASSTPSWSTATYPSSAGSSGNVLRSDGTNFLSAQLTAADLSNGIIGSGAVVLATSPTVALGTASTAVTQTNGDNSTKIATTAYVDSLGTALGDMEYWSASGTRARLAGQTTSTRKFLRQTGNGSISAAPTWDTIVAADISGSALTKVDDTNVTLTLGGSPSTALLNATSITVGWSGQLALSRGGSNANLTASNGGVVYSTSSAMAILAGTATAGQMLRSGSSAAPSWSTATFPATSGSAGNVLRSDGTNFVSAALAAADLSNGVTGSGAVVLANTPSLITPDVGAATGTSINLSSTATASAFIPGGSSVPSNGLYLPAANSIGLSTNSTNAVYINSSQQVGIGTSSPDSKLTLSSNTSTLPGSLPSGVMLHIGNANATQSRVMVDGYGLNPYYSARFCNNTAASPSAVLSGNPICIITGDGYTGSGWTTNAPAKIQFVANNANWNSGSTPTRIDFFATNGGGTTSNNSVQISAYQLNVNDGNLQVDATGALAAAGDRAFGVAWAGNNSNYPTFYNTDSGASSQRSLEFQRNSSVVGSISTTNTTTTYNTSSDYRLKENVISLADAFKRVNLLQPHRFNFKSSPTVTVDGFLAHEVQEVVPEAVIGEKDDVDDNGNPVYQQMDHSKLVPLLAAAVKELIAEVTALKAQLSALS